MNNAESFLKQEHIYVGYLSNSPKLKYKPRHWENRVYWVSENGTTQALIWCNHFMIDFAHIGFVRELYSHRMRLVEHGSNEHAEVLENINRIRRIYEDQEKRDQERSKWIEEQNRYAAEALRKAIEGQRSGSGDRTGATRDSDRRRNGRLLKASLDQLRLIRRRGSGRSRFPRRVEACSKENHLLHARIRTAKYIKA